MDPSERVNRESFTDIREWCGGGQNLCNEMIKKHKYTTKIISNFDLWNNIINAIF